MRFALWLIGLFGVAVAIALFAGSNPGTVTVFWPPYRVDLSLNLVLLVLLGTFTLVHLALRALAALLALPREAERWRAQQRERALHAALFEAFALLGAGRWRRAARAAQELLARLDRPGDEAESDPQAEWHAARLRALAQLLLAESAHALQDRAARDAHGEAAQANPTPQDAASPHWRQTVLLRAAQWALDERQPSVALDQLRRLPPAAGRSIAARRLRLQAARGAGQMSLASQEAHRLARHGCLDARVPDALALERLAAADSADAVARVWSGLDPTLRERTDIAVEATRRWQSLGGAAATARDWLLPAAQRWLEEPAAGPEPQRARLLRALQRCGVLPLPREGGLAAADDVDEQQQQEPKAGMPPREAPAAVPSWRARIVAAQAASPQDPLLQLAAGLALLPRSGAERSAQALLEQAAAALPDARLRCEARVALAQLLERRGDVDAAARAWRDAALLLRD